MQGTLNQIESRESLILENQGQKIFAVLHRPISCDNPPLVVTMHGFASSKHGSNRCYVTLAESLARSGIATLRFDFRGAGDSEGSLSELSLEDLISDALCVIDSVEDIENINAERLGIFGASLGGAIAVLVQARTQKAKALALWAPVASGELWYRDFITQNQGLAPEEVAQVLSSYRGIKLTDAFRDQFAQMFAYQTIQECQSLPILHMHGEKDSVISINHQQAFEKSCSPINPNALFVTYPESQHALGLAPCFPDVIQACMEFFQQTL